MNTFLSTLGTVRRLAVFLAIGLAATQGRAQEEKPLLDYRFDQTSGVTVNDRGSANLPLTASAALGWSARGTGVAGGTALGRVGDRDVVLENRRAGGRGLDGLRAFTVCGWYKARFLERSNGVLFELMPSDGLGYRLHLASRHNEAGVIEYSLVSSMMPKEPTPQAKGGVQYSPWENALAVEDEWVFFAAVVDLRDSTRTITFYSGSANKTPEVILGSFAKPASWADFTGTGKISGVRVANSADMNQPVPVGFYFDDLSFFGSAKESGGALSASEIRAVWERTTGKKGGVR